MKNKQNNYQNKANNKNQNEKNCGNKNCGNKNCEDGHGYNNGGNN